MSIIFLWHTIGPLFTCVVHFFPYFTLSLSGPRFLFALFLRVVWKIAGVFECFFNYFLQYRRFIWCTMLIANITRFLLTNLIWTIFVRNIFFSFQVNRVIIELHIYTYKLLLLSSLCSWGTTTVFKHYYYFNH